MSESAVIRDALADELEVRWFALAGTALLLAAPISVLVHITDVVGGADTQTLIAIVLASAVLSILLARLVRPAIALVLALALLAVGGNWYFLTLPVEAGAALSTDVLIADALALLSGLSILRITNAGQWALAAAPAPVFLTSYLAVRRQYVGAAVVGGGFLALFVLTGDATLSTTLIGVLGAVVTVGFGELESRGGRPGHGDVIAVVMAVMVVATLTVGVVPGGAGSPLSPGTALRGTVEANLVDTPERVAIQGSIRLSPEVRYTVESTSPAYWKVSSYDRYAGDAWLRTGRAGQVEGRLNPPPGRTASITQTFRAESVVDAMPAAWKPVKVTDGRARSRVAVDGTLRPRRPLDPGETYTVVSQRLTSPPENFRDAGTTYPEWIRHRYLQLPESTSQRLVERTDRITETAENPYDTARLIEGWLERNREYSLDVARPEGSIADAFLFEMEAGYCTYYATTMVVMLRTQGIPARFVSGYTTGQRVAEDRWVVRGLDSHAWVEVYFPGEGWVQFDPTPSGPRRVAEHRRLGRARTTGEVDVDTSESIPTPTPAPGANGSTPTTTNGPTPTVANLSNNTTNPFGGSGVSGGFGRDTLPTPSREEVGLGLVVVIGLLAAGRRVGLYARIRAELWLRRHPVGTPDEQVRAAFERLEYLLSSHRRPRRPGETPREYLGAVGGDPRITRLGELYERAAYAGVATDEDATEATTLVQELATERSIRERLRA